MATFDFAATLACRLSRRDPGDSEFYGDALDFVYECYRTVCGMDHPWDFLQMSAQFVTSPGFDVYDYDSIAGALSLADGIKRIIAIVDDDGDNGMLRPMHWISLETLAQSTQGNPSSGSPTHFAQIGTQGIRLWPTPTIANSLGILIEKGIPATLSPTDEMLIPDGFATMVVSRCAAARMWEQHAGTEARLMADRMDKSYGDALAKMVATHGVVRWPFVTFADPQYLAAPFVLVGSSPGLIPSGT